MNQSKFFIVFALSIATSWAFNQANCILVNNVPPSSGSSATPGASCTLGSLTGPGYSSANVALTSTYSNYLGTFDLSAGAEAIDTNVNAGTGPLSAVPVNATASGSNSLQVQTAGASRPGVLVMTMFVSADVGALSGFNNISSSASISGLGINGGPGNLPFTVGAQNGGAHMSGPAGSDCVNFGFGQIFTCTFDVTIGAGSVFDFDLTANAAAGVTGTGMSDSHGAVVDIDSYEFFEANGTTPVALAPEPGAFSLLAVPLLCGIAIRFSRRRKTAYPFSQQLLPSPILFTATSKRDGHSASNPHP